MNLIHQFQLRKTFFVPQDEDDMKAARRALAQQIFQLSYHGKIDATFASTLEVSERNYLYELLKEQLDGEQKAADQELKKINSHKPRASYKR